MIPNRVRPLTAMLTTLAVGIVSNVAQANPVNDWNANAGAAAIASCISPAPNPLHESRLYAMVHIAVHDALNAIDRRSEPYAADFSASGASLAAAVAAAARDVLVSEIAQIPFAPFFPAECADRGIARVEADYAAALADIPPGTAKTAGIAAGKQAAAAIINRRASDGSDTPLFEFNYPQGSATGEWRFTPGFPFAFAPGWQDVAPFSLDSAAQFRPGPPYPVSCRARHNDRPDDNGELCRKYAADFNEVKRLGGDGATTPSERTPEQTEIALFWAESSPLQWNRIARNVAAAQQLDPWQSARLLALLNMSLADGYIASIATKYHYQFWRPVTAIQFADSDDNPYTSPDPSWTPLLPTPPFPDYDSAHAVQGGAASEVLKRFFKRDNIAFSTCSLTLAVGNRCGEANEVLRSFRGFRDAARENGVSRVYVGFHFRLAADEGIEHGRSIGEHTFKSFLKPLRGPRR